MDSIFVPVSNYIRVTTLLAVIATPVFAQTDAPSGGMLYGVKEDHGLRYSCSKIEDGRLRCEFVQTAIRLKKDPSEWPEQEANAKAEWEQMSEEQRGKIQADFCETSNSVLPILRGDQLSKACRG